MTKGWNAAEREREIIELRTLLKELSDALLTARPLGGSECFTFRCGAYYADPSFFKGVIAQNSSELHEARCTAMRWQKGILGSGDLAQQSPQESK